VFGVALGTVILPALARHHVNTDRRGFSEALDWGLRTTLMIAIPAMLGLMLLSVPLVSTLFQHGRFTAFDTHMAALSVFGLSFGLPAFALVKVVLPAFYARQDTKTPVRAGVASLVANMVFNALFLAILYVLWVPGELQDGPVFVALAKVPGLHFALGLASAAASYLILALLWRWLRQAGVYEPKPGWSKFLLRLGAACSAMTLCLLAGLRWAPDFTTIPVGARILWLGVLVGGGVAVYGASMVALGFRLSDLKEH
jgi:putative peptidoglycan lipid II flippase